MFIQQEPMRNTPCTEGLLETNACFMNQHHVVEPRCGVFWRPSCASAFNVAGDGMVHEEDLLVAGYIAKFGVGGSLRNKCLSKTITKQNCR